MMFSSLGVLQRDAPALSGSPEFAAMPPRMAADLAATIETCQQLVRTELPQAYGGATAEWPSPEALQQQLGDALQAVQQRLRQQQARLAAMQALYDDLILRALAANSAGRPA